jgi:hypothetical protein
MIRDLKEARKKKCPILFSMKRGTLASGIPHETIHNCIADDCHWWVPASPPGKGSCAIHSIADRLWELVQIQAGE